MTACWILGLLNAATACLSAPAEHDAFLMLDAGGHTSQIKSVMFSPDGANCYTASLDRTVRVWDLTTGDCNRVFRVPSGAGDRGILTTADLSKDGSLLAVGVLGLTVDHPADVYLLDAEGGAVKGILRGHRKAIDAVAISPDQSVVASGGDDTQVRFHSLDGRDAWFLSGHTGRIAAMAFSPDGRTLATASLDKTVRLWNVPERRLAAVLNRHTDQVRCVAWSPDGSLIASGSRDGRICLDRSDGSNVFASGPLENAVRGVAFLGQDRLVWTLGGGHGPYDCVVFDLTRNAETMRFRKHNNTPFALGVSPDGRLVASCGGNDHDTFVWEAGTGRTVHRLAAPSRSKYVVAWTQDGRSIAWGEERNDDLRTFVDLPLRWEFSPLDLTLKPAQGEFARGRHRSRDVALQWQDDQSLLVLANGAPTATLKVPLSGTGQAESLSGWSLLDDATAVVGTGHGLYRYELATGRLLTRYHGHSSLIYGLAPSPDGRYFVTGAADQTVSIWRVDRQEPLLSIFTAGREWIAWTPEGYYAASPGGERLVGWLVNDGDRTPAFHPAERFYKQFFKPEAIKKLLDVGDIHQAVAMTSGGAPVGPKHIQNALPPKVAITAPAGKVDVGDERLRISAKASGESPVTSLKVYVNGRPHLGTGAERKFSGKNEVTASWSIDVPPGRNTVAVMASNGASHASSEPIVAVRGGSNGESGARLFVLAAGVSKYESDAISKLFYSAAGAKGVADAFKTQSQPAPYEAVVLKELLDADATRKNLLAAFADVEAQMKPTDFAVIYYSGHGDRTKNGFCLLPCDADPKKLDETAITGEELKKALAALKGQVLLVLDACHSGEVIKDLSRDMGREENGLNVLCSSFDVQKSLENNELRQGPFTVALLECLEGKRNKAADGVVYFHHLTAAVPDRVDELTQGVQQVTAQIAPNRPKFPLSKPAK
jgi:WD40 repeat protein